MGIPNPDARLVRQLMGMAVLFAVYVGTAKLGLRFDAVAGLATTVWPPSGIALAALFLFGTRLWPGVALAAFVVNISAASLWGAAIIAAGNTLEAVVGAVLLHRLGFRPQLARLRDVFVLVVAAALASSTLSATFGTVALAFTQGRPAGGYGSFWSTWWIGDVIGDLLIAPLLFTWATDLRLGYNVRRIAEAVVLCSLVVVVGLISFGGVFVGVVGEMLWGTYAVWPFLIWAALRFGPRGATAALFIIAAVTIQCTVSGRGPFAHGAPGESLRQLQIYIALTAGTILTLAAAVAERRQALLARDDFLSVASHELRTPLTALKLRLELAVRLLETSATDPAEAARLSQSVTASRRHLVRIEQLVDDLLDVSRLRADRLSLHLESVDLCELVRETASQLADELARVGCALELDLPEAVHARCDRSRIEQVLTNLIGNAAKYAPGHPVRISVRAGQGRARIDVRDQGPGIPRAEQRRIFEPYRRLRSARHMGGLGLGLHIGRQIAEAHRGALTVESEPGAGALFILELPIDDVT